MASKGHLEIHSEGTAAQPTPSSKSACVAAQGVCTPVHGRATKNGTFTADSAKLPLTQAPTVTTVSDVSIITLLLRTCNLIAIACGRWSLVNNKSELARRSSWAFQLLALCLSYNTNSNNVLSTWYIKTVGRERRWCCIYWGFNMVLAPFFIPIYGGK